MACSAEVGMVNWWHQMFVGFEGTILSLFQCKLIVICGGAICLSR